MTTGEKYYGGDLGKDVRAAVLAFTSSPISQNNNSKKVNKDVKNKKNLQLR